MVEFYKPVFRDMFLADEISSLEPTRCGICLNLIFFVSVLRNSI